MFQQRAIPVYSFLIARDRRSWCHYVSGKTALEGKNLTLLNPRIIIKPGFNMLGKGCIQTMDPFMNLVYKLQAEKS